MKKVADCLRLVCTALEDAGVPYMVTGSVASSLHGVPRATNDVDIVIAPDRAQLFVVMERLELEGLYVDRAQAIAGLGRRTQFNAIDFRNGWKADLIFLKAREFSQTELQRREEIEFEGLLLSFASAEDVLISKLEWAKMGSSERQLVDAAGILRMQGETLDLAYVGRWVDSLGLQEEWRLAREKAV